MSAPAQGSMNIQSGAQGDMVIAFHKVDGLPSVRIMQKRKLLEALGCFDQQNMYVVYNPQNQPIFWVQENTPCLQRNCLPSDCAPWNLSYHNIGPEGLPEGQSGKHFPEFMEINRPCSLTCLCFNRPQGDVTEKPNNRPIGKLADPWHCCNFTYQVFDASGEERMSTNTCCCQVGTLCPCPGNTIEFPIMDTKGQDMATLTKTWMMGDCCPLCFKDWDNFQAKFLEGASADHKMLLMALASFIHLRQFSSNQQNQ